MDRKMLRKAAVSVVIYPPQRDQDQGAWPPVVVCGPEDDQAEEEGRTIIDLLYDGLRVVGLLVEGENQKTIRVVVYEHADHRPECPDTQGRPTLK